EKAFEHALDILSNGIRMVEGCTCADGCSACVGDYHLDKRLVLWGLKCMLEDLDPPQGIKKPPQPPVVKPDKKFQFQTLPSEWQAFAAFVQSTNEYLSRFLAAVPSVLVCGNKLVMVLSSHFYVDWVSEGPNREQVKNLVKQYVAVPSGFEIEYKCPDSSRQFEW
ncbi:MAG: DUF1998 domain-containing protein, partial [Eubacteriales bacterium]